MAVLLNVIARTMNAGGCAIVSAFDAGSAAFNCTMSALSPGERTKLAGRIKELEKKINGLSAGIAKETSKFADPAAALESPAVIALLNAIKELHIEINPLKQRIAEIDAAKGVKNPQEKPCGIPCTIARSITAILPGEKAGLKRKIIANEKKIQQLYVEFAKEVAKQPDPFEAINSASVAAINTKINDLNAENSALKLQIAELDKPKPKPEKPKAAEKKQPSDVKKAPSESSGVARFFLHAIADSVSGYLPGEKSGIERKLAECDKKIQALYLDVAKESAKYPDPAEAVTAAPVVALVAKINEIKAEVVTLNQRKAELSPANKAEKAKAAATAAKAAKEAPVQSPVAAEVVEAVESGDATVAAPEAEGATVVEAVAETTAHAVEEPPALPAEAESSSVMEAVAETSSGAEKDKTKLPSPATGISFEAISNISEFSGIDPVEGSTPYVFSRTKWPEVPAPVLPPPTEEDVTAVVHETSGEAAAEEAVITTEEASAEPAVEEELAVTADIPAEPAAVSSDKESDELSAPNIASMEHPPFVPVPEAEEVFRVHEPVTFRATATDEAPQENAIEAEAAESALSEEVAPVPQDELETAPESAPAAVSEEVVPENPSAPKEAAEAAAEEGIEPSAPVDAQGIVSDHPPIIPGLRPDALVKEESGSGFRTRLLRNQFSILTPAPVETAATNIVPEESKVPDESDLSDPSDSSDSSDSSEELDAPDYFKKMTARRKALHSGEKDALAASVKENIKKRKLTPED